MNKQVIRVKMGKGETPPTFVVAYEGCPIIAGYMYDELIVRDLGIEQPLEVNECLSDVDIRDVYDHHIYNCPDHLTHYYALHNA